MVGKTPFQSFRNENLTRKEREKLRVTAIKTSEAGTLFTDLDFTGANITSITSRAHNNLQSISGGTSGEYNHLTNTEYNGLSYKLTVDTTEVGNVGAGEDDLITYSLPANTLGTNGNGVRITAWGTTANNANAKTLKLYFGSVSLTTSLTTNQASVWRVVSEVIRTASNAQDYNSQLTQGGATTILDIEEGTLTETDSSAITIKCTGDATSDNDIIQKGLIVEFLK